MAESIGSKFDIWQWKAKTIRKINFKSWNLEFKKNTLTLIIA